MKVFVAGASGAVGRRMVPRLLAAGHSSVAVTRDPAKAESLRGAGVSRIVVQSVVTWYRPDDPGSQRGRAVEADALWTDAPEPIGAAISTLTETTSAALKGLPIAVILRYRGF